MKFNELQTLALRKLQVKILPQKLKNLTPKATNPTPNQLHLYTVPRLRVGRSDLLLILPGQQEITSRDEQCNGVRNLCFLLIIFVKQKILSIIYWNIFKQQYYNITVILISV